MLPQPWSAKPLALELFRDAPREYGILPFWFLNGALDPDEMTFQLAEFRDKGMPGIILHGRYGLEMPYIGPKYLERIRFAVETASQLGLKTWIYDEMNWPSGTADGRVLRERPDLAQRYIQCISFNVRGPWFTYLTGGDSRYLDFERSTPLAAFAVGEDGQILDLTPNLSFTDVIPWEVPPGNWRLMYLVEKEADYYIDALNPESTAEFLRIGYQPYAEAVGELMTSDMMGFYTDEPAMHYFLTGADNPIVPWTRNMFARFRERNGYSLRPLLPHLFFDVNEQTARIRYDFWNTLTAFYSDAYYRQIHEWCQEHNVLFTGHMLYEESVRKVIRVEGNLYKHYRHMDVVGVDHLYPYIGDRDRPSEHVALKVASSAAHHTGSERVLCESFGGIFMDATMQRMKWIADWEYVLGVNLLNPHGFHYTLEGPRKRDWPPSMFYQYPWWHYYADFSAYMSRLSYMLTGGRHAAQVGVIWPLNAMFAAYKPETTTPIADRIEHDFNTLTDLLLRAHYDFDFVGEDALADAELVDAEIRLADEAYALMVLPPMTHIQLGTLERLERFVAQGGRLLGMVFLPDKAFDDHGMVDISDRIAALFGVDPAETQRTYMTATGISLEAKAHEGGGKALFMRSYALARQLPMRLQRALGVVGKPESPHFHIEASGDALRYFYAPSEDAMEEITDEVVAERREVAAALGHALNELVTPDIVIDNDELFVLHRVKDEQDLYFVINPTHSPQDAEVTLRGAVQPVLWDPSTGEERPIAPWWQEEGDTHFALSLPAVGSVFVLPKAAEDAPRIVETSLIVEAIGEGVTRVHAYTAAEEAYAVVGRSGRWQRVRVETGGVPEPLVLDGAWAFEAESDNALIVDHFVSKAEVPGTDVSAYTAVDADEADWLPMVPGAWAYQLPAEFDGAYPVKVWYRARFRAGTVPERLDLIVDGFAGSDWEVFVNGEPVTSTPRRSAFDAQMQALEIADLVREGENLVAIGLTLTGNTDGLLDLLKLMGDFSLAEGAGGAHVIAPPRHEVEAAPWTEQGYPFLSGRAVYRRRFALPSEYEGLRVFVEPEMTEDVVEVLVNGESAGVRLWAPYGLEITELLQPGENELSLRVANTLVNLLEAVDQPSGLAGAPRLVAYRDVTLEL